MNLQHVISQMTWSYSRIRCFEDCPYKFFLTYIKCCPEEERFFASYGSFIHAILAHYLNGEIRKEDLAQYYLTHFSDEVAGRPPSQKVFYNYFNDGYKYLSRCNMSTKDILSVEEPVDFKINDRNFVGFIDYVRMDEWTCEMVIGDHKSRALKPRSCRSKPTAGDKELDKYFEQLYLYCKPIKETYGFFPISLEFNCFRTGLVLSEDFDESKYESVIERFGSKPAIIEANEDWNPSLDFFKCRYLCGKSGSCEYCQTNEG